MIPSLLDSEQTSYDEIPYESNAFSQSHPARMAVIGKLFGMTPAPVDRCRVLELGCAAGGNLIPMAYQLPGSEFTGIDFSQRQVAMAQRTIADMGLRNIRIDHGSILDIDASWGAFDYILSHGVYSWVPDVVQEKILAVSRENLAPQGIAYVSYNTYPGWHMRGMIREMMIYHTAQISDAVQKIAQARALIDFLAASVPAKDSHYGLLLKSELEMIKKSKDSYLFHDHLETNNIPVYFYQFIERARRYGLQYLGEAELGAMMGFGFSREVAQTLRKLGTDMIKSEQYMDFLRNRYFRQTLLCREGIALKRNIGPADIAGFLVSFHASVENPPVDLVSSQAQTFRTPRGATFTVSAPLTKAVFMALTASWPQAVDIDTLLKEACRLRGVAEITPRDRQGLFIDLFKCLAANIAEFHTWQADFGKSLGARPRLCPLAAHQLREGLPVVNRRHQNVKLDNVARQIALFLDGTRDRDALLAGMGEMVADGRLVIRQTDGKPPSDPAVIRELLEKALEQTLTKISQLALLD